MSLYNGPPRGGNRGGKDQFNWENVKNDADREYYLGHSVKATTGRWQKGKDVFWYTKEKKEQDDILGNELRAIKEKEEELMAEALGLKPKKKKVPSVPKLNQQDVKQLLNGRPDDEGPRPAKEVEAVKGLGYAPNAVKGAGDAEHEVLAGVGVDLGGGPTTSRQGTEEGHGRALPPPPPLSRTKLKKLQKSQAKEAKRAKKEAKKVVKRAARLAKRAKKEAKREQKGGEQAGKSPASGSGGSTPSSAPSSSPAASPRHKQQAPLHARGRQEHGGHAAKRPRHDSRSRSPVPQGGRHLDKGNPTRHASPSASPRGETRQRHDSPSASPPQRAGRRHDSPSHSRPGRGGQGADADRRFDRERYARQDSPRGSPRRGSEARRDAPSTGAVRERERGQHVGRDDGPQRRHDSRSQSPLEPPPRHQRGRSRSPPRKRQRHDTPDDSPQRLSRGRVHAPDRDRRGSQSPRVPR